MIHPAAVTEIWRSSVIVGKIAATGPIAQLAMKYPRQTVVRVTHCAERPGLVVKEGSDLSQDSEQRNDFSVGRANSQLCRSPRRPPPLRLPGARAAPGKSEAVAQGGKI